MPGRVRVDKATLQPYQRGPSLYLPEILLVAIRCGPASLVRLGRTARFRQAVTVIAATLDTDAEEFSARLVAASATLADTMGKRSRRGGLAAPG